MQNKPNQPGNNADSSAQKRNDQQSQSGSDKGQQGGQPHGKLTPGGGASGNATEQSQSGGGRDQHGSNIKSDQPGQARTGQAQQGSDSSSRGDKQR